MAGLFAAKLKAGLSVGQALYALSVESKNSRLAVALKGLKSSVDRGRPLGEALLDYPDVFDEISVALLGAGEKSKRLPVELQRLSAYLGMTAKIARALSGATTRPLVGLGVGLLILLIGLAVAAPGVEPFLRGLPEHEWPVATHLAVQVSHVARSVLPVVLAVRSSVPAVVKATLNDMASFVYSAQACGGCQFVIFSQRKGTRESRMSTSEIRKDARIC